MTGPPTRRNDVIVYGSPVSTASGTTRDTSRGISDNERKYYSIERAREALGYDPEDDSAAYTLAGDPIEDA